MKYQGRLLFAPAIKPPEPLEGSVWCFAFRGRELLVKGDGDLPPLEELDAAGLDSTRSQYLGTLGNVHCYSAELPPDAQPPVGMRFRDLRTLFGSLDPDKHAVAGRAVQIVAWDRSHQHCGACGEPTGAAEHERSRACPRCKEPMYPRLSPAMIVAVERGDEVLLGRSSHFPPGIFSVLAGFVEPGESAEEAVAREVWEETRITVKDVRYFGSQPWPFPNSLMLGFTAQYESGEIEVENDELEAADWFHVDDMPTMFPGSISISQWLIQDFLERHRK